MKPPCCPKDSLHGSMSMGHISTSWDRGVGNGAFPLKVSLESIPAFVCNKCQKKGINTYIIPRDLDDSFTKLILNPVNSAIKRNIRKYDYPLPELKFVFNSPKSDTSIEAQRDLKFDIVVPKISIDQVILPEDTKNQIDQVVTFMKNENLIFNDWGMKNIVGVEKTYSINFFGPSGTGKTITAEAIAKELNLKFLRVNYSELESKWVGDTPKNIEKVFDLASSNNALLFFDEADSFLGKRITNVSQAADYSVNVTRSVMLMKLEHFKGVVIFATNLLSNYDPAFARRFNLLVQFTIPDTDEIRKKLWEIHIPKELPLASDVDFGQLSEKFKNVSGGDIKNAVVSAVIRAISRTGEKIDKQVCAADFEYAISSIIKSKEAVGDNKSEFINEILNDKDCEESEK